MLEADPRTRDSIWQGVSLSLGALADPRVLDAVSPSSGEGFDPEAYLAYSQSKIAVSLFAQELDARSRAAGWGITSNLAHPGVSPTNLLAAQPGLGRKNDTNEIRLIRVMSRLGIAGTPESAALPAILAATAPASDTSQFFGPRRQIGGRPVELTPWSTMNTADARRMWETSEQLIGFRLTT